MYSYNNITISIIFYNIYIYILYTSFSLAFLLRREPPLKHRVSGVKGMFQPQRKCVGPAGLGTWSVSPESFTKPLGVEPLTSWKFTLASGSLVGGRQWLSARTLLTYIYVYIYII